MVTRVMMVARTLLAGPGVLVFVAACGATNPPARAPEPEPSRPVTAFRPADRPSLQLAGAAHRLVIGATACWLAGVWSDAMGSDDEARARDSTQRCHAFIESTYGADDPARYERLRALEPGEIGELGAKVSSVAKGDPKDHARSDQLVRLLGLIADAQRETMHVRRAGDRVKKDEMGERTPSKLTGDSIDAVAGLQASSSFQALWRADVGDLAPEARVIALLSAMDRLETARGLQKHLKVYAVQGPLSVLFGVQGPTVTDPLPPGAWLSYLTDVARAAGHPVPEEARTPKDRDLMAWGGTAMGLADKLRLEADRVSDVTDLARMAKAVSNRIEIEFRASQAAIRAQQ